MSSDGQVVQLDTWADQGHWFLLPLLLIAALAGRRGWLFCLPLLFMFPQNSQAFEFQDLWLRPDQQGQRLLEQHRPAEAAQRFEDPRWKGVAFYQAEDYVSAAQQFAEGNSAADHYNRGNALARSGELAAALDAYEQAWTASPSFPRHKPTGRWYKACWTRPMSRSLPRMNRTRPIRAKKASKRHRTPTAVHCQPIRTRPARISPVPARACRQTSAVRPPQANRRTTSKLPAHRSRPQTPYYRRAASGTGTVAEADSG